MQVLCDLQVLFLIFNCQTPEYNELADRYNKLIDDKVELERKNREKAYEVMYQQERGI